MSVPEEHDYITGLSMEKPVTRKVVVPSPSSGEPCNKGPPSLHLKATDLRLGPPGSQSPERESPANTSAPLLFSRDVDASNVEYSLGGSVEKNFVSGAKRGFTDAIVGSPAKWVLSGNDNPDVGFLNCGALFSPRGENGSGRRVLIPVKKEMDQNRFEVAQPEEKATEKSKQGCNENIGSPASKSQVVGWPPIRSFRKNSMASNTAKTNEEGEVKVGYDCLYVKVSMEGIPYLRKLDLKTYNNYMELSSALGKMFSCFTIGKCGTTPGHYWRDGINETSLKDLLHDSEYVLTYEDKDGDWMLVGDVPWEMFSYSCKKLRIMKGSEAIGLAPRAMEKCKNRN